MHKKSTLSGYTNSAIKSRSPFYNIDDLTPVETHDGVWVKRDDLFEIAGVRGGKARTCWHLAQGASGLVTAGSRSSPQAVIVANIAQHLGIPCEIHMPSGELSRQAELAQQAGAEIVQHRPGYNSVIIKRARDAALKYGYKEIPFGMECAEAVNQTRKQVKNLPLDSISRIVVPVGSGMSLAGILHGLNDMYGFLGFPIQVLGICVGADPINRLNKYAPIGWQYIAQLIRAEEDYSTPIKDAFWGTVELDEIYEAKCIPFLEGRPDDLFWIVGLRNY
jgi:1-aminocyclopropane-1-carboxylate deaminase/D-cysteine desulfhydrase-like pyridoxal-dependent ACC family enzyme